MPSQPQYVIDFQQSLEHKDIAGMKQSLQDGLARKSLCSLVYVLRNSAGEGFEDLFDVALSGIDALGVGVEQLQPHFNEALKSASLIGHINIINKLTPRCSFLADALLFAANQNQVDALRVFSPLCTSEQNEDALKMAAKFGHKQSVELLLSYAPTPLSEEVLSAAVVKGRLDVVKVLAPLSKHDDEVLVLACVNSHTRIVEELIQYNQSEKSCSQGLVWAIFNEDDDIAQILLPWSNKAASINYFDGFLCPSQDMERIEAKINQLFAVKENDIIASQVAKTNTRSPVRKI